MQVAKKKLVTNDRIQAGDVIVGLASYGMSTYENEYNSGIGSNGLTSARHDVLSSYYTQNYKESYNNSLDEEVVYIGRHRLTDPVTFSYGNTMITTDIGKLILSPTRTYAPVLKNLLGTHFEKIHGLIHCSGGGQTKCMKYLPGNFRVVKDNLFDPPEVFNIIRDSSGSSNKEMYEVFNMGCRLEIYCAPEDAAVMIAMAKEFNIDAQQIGRVEAADKKELVIRLKDEVIFY